MRKLYDFPLRKLLSVSLIVLMAGNFAKAQSISGTVFEDPSYGGGAGRSLALSSGNRSAGTTVELYDNAGNFLQSTTTNASGLYSFSGLAAGTFTVRVVNATVVSGRPGYINTVLAVQTYRTNSTAAGVVTPVTDRVGGEIPAEQDAPANTASSTLAALDAVASQEVQSIASVTIAAATNVTGIDFGFNFDLIVNVNDAGQGSYAQFLINATNLGGESSLAQSGNTWNALSTVNALMPLPAGKETSIFMVADGNTHPGLRAGLPNLLSAAGVAVINTSANIYPVLAYTAGPNPDNTSLDGGTQTANIGNTNNTVLGTGGTVGIGPDAVANTGDESTLSKLNGPEVEIAGVTGQYPLQIWAANVTIRCISIHSNAADIHLMGGGGYLIEQCVIGAAANSFSPPAVLGGSSRALIYFDIYCTSGTVQNNLIGFSSQEELRLRFFDYTNIDYKVLNNEIAGGIPGTPGGGPGISMNDNNTFDPNNASAKGTVLVKGNLVRDCGPTGFNSGIHYNVASKNILQTTLQENTLTRSSAGFQALFGSGNDILIYNLINDNRTMGVRVANRSADAAVVTAKVKITKNSIYNNGTAVTTGGLGIDLNEDNVTANSGAYDNTIPNLRMNYPIIATAALSGTVLSLTGYVGSAPGQSAFGNVTVELFKANASDANQKGEVIVGDGKSLEHGEGQIYLGSFTTDAAGNFSTLINTSLIAANDKVTATATDASGNTSEFSVAYVIQNAVPVNFISFDAKKVNKSVDLKWTVANEVNVRSYIIERSNGSSFKEIGTVDFSGNATGSPYAFRDNNPFNGKNLYRITEKDIDGRLSYSDVRFIFTGTDEAAHVFIFPNPATDFITVNFPDADKDNSIRILNTEGKTVLAANEAGKLSDKILLRNITPGIYFVETSYKGTRRTERIIIK